jgi:hypothetical protein
MMRQKPKEFNPEPPANPPANWTAVSNLDLLGGGNSEDIQKAIEAGKRKNEEKQREKKEEEGEGEEK